MELASLFKTECGDQFRIQSQQMIADYLQRADLSEKYQTQSKKLKPGQSYSFLILDSSKWPIKNHESLTIMPREIKDIYEEFTQMYERSKRGTSSAKAAGLDSKSGKNSRSKDDKAKAASNPQANAIIMNWNIFMGDCELQTYSLNDPNRAAFTLKLSCLQGLILLQFEAGDQ